MKKVTRSIGGKDAEITMERSANGVRFRCGERTHDWTPHAKVGRTSEEFRAELDATLESFIRELEAAAETQAHLDELLKEETP